jgi:hypothetical protein
MNRQRFLFITLWVVCASLCLAFPLAAAEPEMVINLDVTSKAKITKITLSKGKWANSPAVWVMAKVKNVSDQPIQYKTKCDFPGTDISRGFMVPKVGKPLLKPGAVGTAKFPFPAAELPKKMTIKVEDFSLED